MKKILGTGAALALLAGTAFAADMPVKAPYLKAAPSPVWDIAIGGNVASDYNFRGISQSDRHASGGAYFELQYNGGFGQLYVATAMQSIDLQTGTEVDIYGGWRNTWGKFSLDLGYIYYWYPKEKPTYGNALAFDTDFQEVYAKAAYAITPDLTFGASVFYTPDVLHLSTAAGLNGLDGIYTEASLKWVTPLATPTRYGPLGMYVSGAVGHWDIEQNAAIFGGIDVSYTYYNVGVAFTLSALTLDLRYHDTDLSAAECVAFTGFAPANRWCSGAFIAKLSFDTLLSKIKN
jgi:uncharacterized protein (TIGR02001 family)